MGVPKTSMHHGREYKFPYLASMNISSYGLGDIKKELQHLSQQQVAELCLRLARYKKDNKELLAYLLFESTDEHAFVEKVKAEVGFMFSQLPSQSYNAAKGARKILRQITKYVKFMGSKEAEIDLWLSFCNNYIEFIDRRMSYKPLRLILTRQILKIQAAINKLHEDLQYDFVAPYETLLDEAAKHYPWFYKGEYTL